VCNGSGFDAYKDSYKNTRLAHEKHHIQDNLAQIPNDEGLCCFLFKIIEYGVT